MNSGNTDRFSPAGKFGAVWGIVGLSLIFSRGLFALYPYAMKVRNYSFTWYHWLALVISLVFMGYAEGYKGFQLKFSPRAAARALYLRSNPTPVRIVFAPFFCMGYFHATRKRKIISYSITAMIVGLIIGVHHTPQPWHGIIDVGVLFGLGYGMVSVWVFTYKAFCSEGYDVSPETPDA